VILFMQNLFHHVTDVVLELAKFAVGKNPATSSQKKHLITLTSRQPWKLFSQMGKEDDSHEGFVNDVVEPSLSTGTDLGRVESRRIVKKRLRTWQSVIHTLASLTSRASRITGSWEAFLISLSPWP
jgi:hypothetical protein